MLTITQQSDKSSLGINLYLVIYLIYFFVNAVGLPFGLLYTTALAPVFYFWLLKNDRQHVATLFVLVSLPFVLMHLLNGVINPGGYVISYFLLMAVYISGYAFYLSLLKCGNLSDVFNKIIVINFMFTLVAVLAVYVDSEELTSLLWWDGYTVLGEILRLKLLTYEPSYYSLMLTPLVLFSYFRMIRFGRVKDWLLFTLTVIPLVLSFSFGVIAGLMLSLLVTHLYFNKTLYLLNRKFFHIALPILMIIFLALILFTPFYDRLVFVLSGQDASGTGRMYWSSVLAVIVANEKSLIWGVGFGQTKEYFDLMNVYMYWVTDFGWMNGRLYNSVAEIISTAGIAGLLLKFSLAIYLFVVTRVPKNFYRFSLFIFIFIYQFTGSFYTNIAEYVIWVMAFTAVFQDFELKVDRQVPIKHKGVSARAG